MMVEWQGHGGGRRGSKGSKLTPLEDFVQSNMPLQGRSLFKRISLEPEGMVSPPLHPEISYQCSFYQIIGSRCVICS
jgi:hypothetical protein